MCVRQFADYTPKDVSSTKIKKGEDTKIELVRTKDILKELRQQEEAGANHSRFCCRN